MIPSSWPLLAASSAGSWALWVPVIVALVAAVTSLVSLFFTNRATRKRDVSQARLQYESEARKRLYDQLGPLLFQLGTQSEDAFWRVVGLAKSAKDGRLCPGETDRDKNRLRETSKTYLPSTIYRFMAPLASYWLYQRRLTDVDLSLDPEINLKYRLTKMLYRSWTDGEEIGKVDQKLPYTPRKHGTDAQHAKQHVSLQRIETLLEAMILPTPATPQRVMTSGEFISAYCDPNSTLSAAIEDFRNLFVDFSPGSRPVLWRLLVAQTHLYAALSGCTGMPVQSDPAILLAEQKGLGGWFDWMPDEQFDADKVSQPIDAACMYLRDQGWDRLPWNGAERSAAAGVA
jgi:hypothetical protein